LQESVAFCINSRVCMLSAIHFDYDLVFHTDEIEDVIVVGMLSAEFAIVQLAPT
jgi:hypothetical protein